MITAIGTHDQVNILSESSIFGTGEQSGHFVKRREDLSRSLGGRLHWNYAHHADIKQIEVFWYDNTGDVVESYSAIIEHFDGSLSLQMLRRCKQEGQQQKATSVEGQAE